MVIIIEPLLWTRNYFKYSTCINAILTPTRRYYYFHFVEYSAADLDLIGLNNWSSWLVINWWDQDRNTGIWLLGAEFLAITQCCQTGQSAFCTLVWLCSSLAQLLYTICSKLPGSALFPHHGIHSSPASLFSPGHHTLYYVGALLQENTFPSSLLRKKREVKYMSVNI
jgi:hypothetical protein